jgi:hypothetical protein
LYFVALTKPWGVGQLQFLAQYFVTFLNAVGQLVSISFIFGKSK